MRRPAGLPLGPVCRLAAALSLVAALAPALAFAHQQLTPPRLRLDCRLTDAALTCDLTLPEAAGAHLLGARWPAPADLPVGALGQAAAEAVEARLGDRAARPTPTLVSVLAPQDAEVPERPGLAHHPSQWPGAQVRLTWPLTAAVDQVALRWTAPGVLRAVATAGDAPQVDGRLDALGGGGAFRLDAAAPQVAFTLRAASAAPPPPARDLPWGWLGAALVALLALTLRPRGAPWLPAAAVAALALGGATWTFARPAPLPPDDARATFGHLHRTLYAAFAGADEDAVYDALARAVAGPLLERVYTEVRDSMVLRHDGDAVAHVDGATLLEATVGEGATDAAFGVHARWEVHGTVTHYGHTHRRTNVYGADFRVERGDAGWRIVGMDVVETARVERVE